MIEIIVLPWLCIRNAKNAKARGLRGSVAVRGTLGLWFFCEILGAAIGFLAFVLSSESDAFLIGVGTYAVALTLAIMSGIGSYRLWSNVTGDLRWGISDGTLTISGTGFMRDYINVQVSHLEDIQGPWFPYRSGFTHVNIGAGIRSIGKNAFKDCSNLTSVTIPNSVTFIDKNAFKGCSSLTSVTIPNSVKTIGECAFEGCSSLTSVTIPNSVKTIGECAFEGCSGLPTDFKKELSGITVANLKKLQVGMKAEQATALLGEPQFVMESAAAFAMFGTIPEWAIGKENWVYKTPYGEFQLVVQDKKTVVEVKFIQSVIDNLGEQNAKKFVRR